LPKYLEVIEKFPIFAPEKQQGFRIPRRIAVPEGRVQRPCSFLYGIKH